MSANTAPAALSPRRLAANRDNARRSTGPRTEAGKRISSQNARKAPPCPIDFNLPRPFAVEWFQEALRRTAACPCDQARLLLINRCMLQAHEIRWRALERTLFDTACAEAGGDHEEAARFIAHQPSFVKALKTYYHWIARRILHVERQLAAIAGAATAPATVKVMAAGSSFDATAVQPDGSFVISWNRTHLGAAPRPVPPVPPVPAVGPVRPVAPIRGRYRLYPHCPSGPLHLSNGLRPLIASRQNEAAPSIVRRGENRTQLPIVIRETETAVADSEPSRPIEPKTASNGLRTPDVTRENEATPACRGSPSIRPTTDEIPPEPGY